MKSPIIISVIITCYNAEKTIEKTIDSVFLQKGIGEKFTLDLIVVDDCSSDRTTDILSQKNIEYFSTKKNSGGPNKGRNIGLEKAKGEYICFMDHDDEWVPEKTIIQLNHIGSSKVISCGYFLFNTKTEAQTIVKKEAQNEVINYSKNKTFLKLLSKDANRQITYFGSLMIHKSLADIRFEEAFGMVDFDWILKIFHHQASKEICLPLFVRNMHGDNLSLNKTYRKKDFYYSLYHIENYREEFPKQYKKGYQKIHGTRARFHYLINEMKEARFFFRKSGLNLKTILYILTSYWGHKWVKKNFKVF